MNQETDRRKSSGGKKWTIFAVKVLVSTVLLSIIATTIDFSKMIGTISAVDPLYPIISIVVLAAQISVVTLRWSTISRFFDLKIPFFPALKISYVGLLANQGVPSFIAGDALRIYWLKKQGNALDAAFRVTIIDRVAAMVALIFMMILGLPYLLSLSDSTSVSMSLWFIALGGIFGVIIIFVLDRLPAGFYRFKVLDAIAAVSQDVRTLSAQRRLSFLVILQALIGHLLTATFIYLLTVGMGLPISFFQCLALMPPVILISMLPFTIAGWGVREGVMITGMALYHIDAEAAFAVSLFFGIMGLLHSLIGVPALLFSDTGESDAEHAMPVAGRPSETGTENE